MQLPFFQQRQLERAQDILTRSVSNHARTEPYPASKREMALAEENFKNAYQSILKLSRRQAQWLVNKRYSDAEKTALLIMLGPLTPAKIAYLQKIDILNKNIQTGLRHLKSRTR